MINNFFDFVAGTNGQWKITNIITHLGDALAEASYLNIKPSSPASSKEGTWTLRGFTSNVRYAEKQEREKLQSVQEELGRPFATEAVLIPIKKSEAWWSLAQDERREIFETKSRHTEVGLKYLPAIARKLYHCRDIGEPFDFLTWFEFDPQHNKDFGELLASLRCSEEWRYVERDIEIRLVKVID